MVAVDAAAVDTIDASHNFTQATPFDAITAFIGIDVSKLTFNVSLRLGADDKERKRSKFNNNAAGFAEFDKWLDKHLTKQPSKRYHACCEATGVYFEALATHIAAAGNVISVLNPKIIKHYGEAQMTRNKTDAVDANLIARYCQRERPAAWDAPTPAMHALLQMTRQLDHLKLHQQGEQNRLQTAHASVIESVARTINTLDEQIADMQKAIDQHIGGDSGLKAHRVLLESISGIGPVSSQSLLAILRDGERFGTARQAVAYAGLAPVEYSSGSSVHRQSRISKQGSAELRRIMFMPAFSMYGKRGVYKAFIERLEVAGKRKMQIITALMRKILSIAQAVLKSKIPFDAKLHANLAAG